MNLSTQLENNEQRSISASGSTVQAVMPGSLALPIGEVHKVGQIPINALVTGFTLQGNRIAADLVVNVGTASNPTFFVNAGAIVAPTDAITNSKIDPMQDYFPEGEDILLEVVSGDLGADGTLRFVLNFTELETNLGAYTA